MDKNAFLFITNDSLRAKIISSIFTISGLYLVEEKQRNSPELAKEIRRVIILYSAFIIEAILLFMFKKKSEKLEKIDYKDVYELPSNFQTASSYTLVVAKQVKIPKHERELMLDVLLKYYVEKGIISRNLESKIKKVKDIRNTFHLSKPRSGLRISQNDVQSASDTVYETILMAKDNI
jgi:hypothetical protein